MVNTAIEIKADRSKSIEQIRAEVAAFEANPVEPTAPETVTPTATDTVKPQEVQATPTPEKAQEVVNTEEKPQQPKEVVEKVEESKTPKTESDKNIDWKARYIELQRKATPLMQEKAKEKSAEKQVVQQPQVLQEEFPNVLPDELKKKLDEDSAKDPWETIDKLIRTRLNQAISPVKSKLEQADMEKQEQAKINSLDNLAKSHEWLKTDEGMKKMESVLNENTWLWNTPDPYRAALGFINDVPVKGTQSVQAQSTGLTPMLGVSGAVPPTTPPQVVSKEAKLESMMKEANLALSRGQLKKAQEIHLEIDRMEKGY